jgi:hypothetical protein
MRAVRKTAWQVGFEFSFALAVAGSGSWSAVAQEPANELEIRSQMATAEKLSGKIPDRGAVLFFLAAGHAQLGEFHASLAKLQECVALKEGFDPQGEPSFAVLKDSKEFPQLVEQAHKDFPVVAQAQLAFTTSEKDLVPEGLAYDPAADTFYLGSLHRRKIVRIPRAGPMAGKSNDFVPGDRYDLLPVLGIRMDPVDGTIWCNSFADSGKAALLHFDQAGALLGRFRIQDEVKHGFNDLVVLGTGEVYVTDSLANRVYRFDRKTQAFTSVGMNRELLYPNGIAVTDNGQYLYVADALGVMRFDPKTKEAAEVDPGPRSTLAGIDGLYWQRDRLIAIQNGIGSPRIALFQIANDGLHVSKTTVLENRTKFTTLPTTGALLGDDFYFIANSQIDNLNGARILDVTKLEPVRIGKIHLP